MKNFLQFLPSTPLHIVAVIQIYYITHANFKRLLTLQYIMFTYIVL